MRASSPIEKLKNKTNTNMKTITRFSLIVTAVSAIALSSLGLNAAEKGAELLAKRNLAPAAVNNARPAAMNCLSCTDSWVTVVDKGTKGPRHEVNNVVRHNCASCDTRIVPKGSGKNATTVALHSCGAGSASICATR
jgi:hypothetical protein